MTRTGRPPLVLPAAIEMCLDAQALVRDARIALERAETALALQARALSQLERRQHETGPTTDGRPPS